MAGGRRRLKTGKIIDSMMMEKLRVTSGEWRVNGENSKPAKIL